MKIKKFLFSKEYGSLYYKLSCFFKFKMPFVSKLWNEYHNPLYHWWKGRKYFKRPKAHLHIGNVEWFFGFPCRKDYLNPIIDFRMSGLGWKDKWNTPRHEWDPYISITLFRKWQILWMFNWVNKNDKNSATRSMATWEALLDHIYYKKSILTCIKYHSWNSCLGKDAEKITIESNLK